MNLDNFRIEFEADRISLVKNEFIQKMTILNTFFEEQFNQLNSSNDFAD